MLKFTSASNLASRAARTVTAPLRRLGPPPLGLLAAAAGLNALAQDPSLGRNTAAALKQAGQNFSANSKDLVAAGADFVGSAIDLGQMVMDPFAPNEYNPWVPLPAQPDIPAEPLKWNLPASLAAGYTWSPAAIWPCRHYPNGNVPYIGPGTSWSIGKACTLIAGSKIERVSQVADWVNDVYYSANGRVYVQLFDKSKENFPPWISDPDYVVVDQTGRLQSSAGVGNNPAHAQHPSKFIIDAVPAQKGQTHFIIHANSFPEPIYVRNNPFAFGSYGNSLGGRPDPFDAWGATLPEYKRPADKISISVGPDGKVKGGIGAGVHANVPPAPYEHEIKGKSGVAYRRANRFLSRTFGASGELRDLVHALYKALPYHSRVAIPANNKLGYVYRRVYKKDEFGNWSIKFLPVTYRKPPTADMAYALYKNYKQLDMTKVRDNVIATMLNDAMFGARGQAFGEVQKRMGLPVGAGRVLAKYFDEISSTMQP